MKIVIQPGSAWASSAPDVGVTGQSAWEGNSL
jgi:hypothetical protein